jgi:GT2 family glycosyltransferase
MRNKPTDIIVVDSASSDGTQAMIKLKHPHANLLNFQKNVGPTVGYNAGMKSAKTPYILLLNSDTYIQKDTLISAVSFMEQHSDCDILTCRLLNADGSLNSYCGHLPTPFKTIRWLFGFESIPILRNFMSRIYGYNPETYIKNSLIEWAPSSFLFLRDKVYALTGGHDEHIFIYMDDVEWCQQIKNKGFSLWFSPEFSATHLGGSSTVNVFKNSIMLRWQMDGVKYFQQKYYPKTFWVVNFFIKIGLSLRAVFYYFTGKPDLAKIYWSVLK